MEMTGAFLGYQPWVTARFHGFTHGFSNPGGQLPFAKIVMDLAIEG
jgi:hypothetical protein